MEGKMTPLRGMDVSGKRILFRPDINSPIDPVTKKIVNENRLRKNAPTLKYMLDGGASVAIIAHQGDTLDYQNLIPMEEHAEKLSKLVGRTVRYIDDVCGPAAVAAVKSLNSGEALLLGNLRYLGEELSTFEKDVKLKPQEMLQTYLVRSLAPLFDLYVNDAFAAAHRNAPSMVAFEELLPSAAGFQLYDEYSALTALRDHPRHPAVFVLGGAKISDAFDMIGTALKCGTADRILTTGLTAIVMLLAKGVEVGQKTVDFLSEKDLLVFLKPAREYLELYGDKIVIPIDFAIEENGFRKEIDVSAMPLETLYLDIGTKTTQMYAALLKGAEMIFANGPAGVYEDARFADGTRGVWQAIVDSKGYSVIGGGDTVNSATKFIDLSRIDYVCTAGGAMIRFMSGKKLPLIGAMEKAFTAYSETPALTNRKELELFAARIRLETMKEFKARGFGHVGGALSIADTLAVLYHGVMNVDPANPSWPERDKLICSKGHAGPALYATLALRGFFPLELLETLNKPGTTLPSHCDRNKTPGVDMTTGSLGQGISAAIGIALGDRLRGRNAYTYLILGDGECDEGQVWEGAMFAAHHKLDRLIAFVDYNHKQLDGTTEDILCLGDIASKFASFGWHAQCIAGNDVAKIAEAIEKAKATQDQPCVIVLNTRKGAGVIAVEEMEFNHHITVSSQMGCEAIECIEQKLIELGGA